MNDFLFLFFFFKTLHHTINRHTRVHYNYQLSFKCGVFALLFRERERERGGERERERGGGGGERKREGERERELIDVSKEISNCRQLHLNGTLSCQKARQTLFLSIFPRPHTKMACELRKSSTGFFLTIIFFTCLGLYNA